MQNNAGHFPHANVENRAPGIFRTIVDEKGLRTLIVPHDKAFVFKDVGQCIVNIGIVVDNADNRSGVICWGPLDPLEEAVPALRPAREAREWNYPFGLYRIVMC